MMVNFDQVDGAAYDDWSNGRVDFESPRPRVETGVKEAWSMTCTRPDGKATSPVDVVVDRASNTTPARPAGRSDERCGGAAMSRPARASGEGAHVKAFALAAQGNFST